MALLGINQVRGDQVSMLRTNSRHLNPAGKQAGDKTEPGQSEFGKMVMDSMETVNSMQKESDALFQKMVTDPDSVDPHDVTVAMAKATMSLNMTKTVVDRAVKAYKDIISLR